LLSGPLEREDFMRAVTRLFPIAAALATCAPATAQEPAPGQGTWEGVCSVCHSLVPPAKQAPPMAHVVRHYRAADSTAAGAASRIAAWVRAPARERSLMPAMAIERWGVMPPVAIGEREANDVARYVISLADSADGGGMGHGGMRGGPPMGRGRMMGRRGG
jgi:hypothetical protein